MLKSLHRLYALVLGLASLCGAALVSIGYVDIDGILRISAIGIGLLLGWLFLRIAVSRRDFPDDTP